MQQTRTTWFFGFLACMFQFFTRVMRRKVFIRSLSAKHLIWVSLPFQKDLSLCLKTTKRRQTSVADETSLMCPGPGRRSEPLSMQLRVLLDLETEALVLHPTVSFPVAPQLIMEIKRQNSDIKGCTQSEVWDVGVTISNLAR